MMLALSAVDAWLEFVGRLHPVFLHFPIALGVVAAVVELWGAVRRQPGPSSFALTAIWFAAVVAVVTAFSGWFFAEYEVQEATLNLFLHRWTGIACAVLLVALAIGGSFIRAHPTPSRSGAWRMLLLATAGGLAFTGHLGGSMVYGDGFVTDAFWAAIDQTEKSQRDAATRAAKKQLGIADTAVVADASAAASSSAPATASVPVNAAANTGSTSGVDFVKQVVPILSAHCYECHGNGKHKGGVYLDDWSRMTTARKGEFVVKPGDPKASLMLINVELPADDDSAMPPEGDRLTPTQIAIIRTWIEQGAPSGGVVASPRAESDNRWTLPERPLKPEELARIQRETSALASLGVIVQPLAQESSNYEANASLATQPIENAQLSQLAQLADFLVVLNLAHCAIADDASGELTHFSALRVLRLDHTKVGDQVAASLAKMQKLESINFVATELTDDGLNSLRSLKSLRKLYVWSSRVTPEGSKQFRLARPDVQLIDGQE